MNIELFNNKKFSNNKKIVGISLILLISVLFPRFISLLSDYFSWNVSLRMMISMTLLFIFIIPILTVFFSMKSVNIRTSFLLPFLVTGLVFPVCDALFLEPFALLTDPLYYIMFLILALGLGLVGIAGNVWPTSAKKSIGILTIGLIIVLLNSMNILPVFYYAITGDMTPLYQIPDFL